MAESNTFTGNISSLRTTHQTLVSNDAFSKIVQFAAFNKTPFTKAIGVEAFGTEAMTDLQVFGAAKPSGRILTYDSGVYGVRGAVFATAPSSYHVGRMGNFTPQLTEGGDEWAYSWHRLIQSQYIPDVDVQDNGKGNFDIKVLKMRLMQQQFVKDFNYAILGNSDAPDAGTMGPSAVQSDLPHLISVTQTSAITPGAIGANNEYWQNGRKSLTSLGGGGQLDRPLMLRRALMDMLNDQLQYAEASNDYLLLCTQGAWQYYDRLMYADAGRMGLGGAFGTVQKYDAAGIPTFAFNGNPMTWDPAVTIPTGATAGTEAIYGIHIPSYFVSIRSEENFVFTGWEEPRTHDQQRTLQAQLRLRYTPGVRARRPHCVLYDIPANTD